MEGISQRMGDMRQRCVLDETVTAQMCTRAVRVMGLSDTVHLSGMEEGALKPCPFLWD